MELWNAREKEFFYSLKNPADIQGYLDSICYDPREGTSSPRFVMREEKANCFEGALLAAACLERLGHKPLILDFMAYNDDDHVIAVYKQWGYWGALAKSNTTVLRGREAVYKNIRELAMSYFDFYINTCGEKTLRSYSKPFNLKAFDNHNWRTTPEDLEFIGDKLWEIKHYDILTPKMIKNLSRPSQAVIDAIFLGSDAQGLYKPE